MNIYYDKELALMKKNNIKVSKLKTLSDDDDVVFVNDNDKYFTKVASLANADKGELTFCDYDSQEVCKQLQNTNSDIVITRKSNKELISGFDKTFILTDNPRILFLRVMDKYFAEKPSGWDSIGTGVDIPKDTCIGRNVIFIGDVKIGRRCRIHPGVIIGSDGFAFGRNKKGELEKVQQLGYTIIQDDVEILSGTVVCRGALDATVIGKGTKIDQLVHVAHNCRIGKNCFIAAGAIFGGSTMIGDNCFIGLNCVTREHTKIGDNVTVGMGAVVTKDVESDVVVYGNPARVHG